MTLNLLCSLNDNLTTITTLTATYNSSFSWTTSGLGLYAYKYLNKILMVTGFMYSNETNGIAYDSVLATINNVNIHNPVFHSSNGSYGTNCRLTLKNNGSNLVLRNESVIPKGEWFSFTFTVFLK